MTDKIQSSSQILLLGTNMFSVILVYLLSCLCLRLHSLSGHDAWSDVFLVFMHFCFLFLWPPWYPQGLRNNGFVWCIFKTAWYHQQWFSCCPRKHGISKNRQCTVQIEALWSSHVTLPFEWMEYSIRRRKCDLAFLWLCWCAAHSLLETLARARLRSSQHSASFSLREELLIRSFGHVRVFVMESTEGSCAPVEQD